VRQSPFHILSPANANGHFDWLRNEYFLVSRFDASDEAAELDEIATSTLASAFNILFEDR
jgi:hypothetical protein